MFDELTEELLTFTARETGFAGAPYGVNEDPGGGGGCLSCCLCTCDIHLCCS